MFTHTIHLLEVVIKPVYLFNGQPLDLKKQELAKQVDDAKDLAEAVESGNREDIEKFSKWAVKVTKQHNEDCNRLSRLMGLPMIDAPSEVEARCAALCVLGKVYAVASEDVDSFNF
ncbi:hypothetical protein SLA2020_216420 [Shorea laevis]